jgi:hypothetical protein
MQADPSNRKAGLHCQSAQFAGQVEGRRRGFFTAKWFVLETEKTVW